MKKIKEGEYKKAQCDWCPEKAVWRIPRASMYSCDEHKAKLQGLERAREDDGYMSEADHQSWGRL